MLGRQEVLSVGKGRTPLYTQPVPSISYLFTLRLTYCDIAWNCFGMDNVNKPKRRTEKRASTTMPQNNSFNEEKQSLSPLFSLYRQALSHRF